MVHSHGYNINDVLSFKCISATWSSIPSWMRFWLERLKAAVRMAFTFLLDSLMILSSHQNPCSSQQSSMKQSRCGYGNMRQKKGPTTSTWTSGRRSASELWTKLLLTHHQQVQALQRPPLQMPQKKSRRKKPPTLLWDQSVNQAWDSCHGGQTASCNQCQLRRKSFQWMFGGLRDPAGAHCSFEAE